MSKHFIGFGNTRDWFNALDQTLPVEFNVIVDPGRFGKFGVALHRQYLVLSQVQRSEVLYCRVLVDNYQTLGTDPLDNHAKHERRAESAFSVAEAWLKEMGVSYRKAIVAVPHNLKLLEGYAHFMRYSKDTDSYALDLLPDWLKSDGEAA